MMVEMGKVRLMMMMAVVVAVVVVVVGRLGWW
ncbi:hypothetical protein E2C01_070030 [Portunus trituberculatus]|uniref:Uncharacterized protein n=1 Tax=Portunus trituberculatus TaxID=210409 RepID=A0A5B7I2G9_PORTR|nr:hypothetical protein [Portunus trituberculatus]